MADAASLISAFKDLNSTNDSTVANFTPSLIGMFGSAVLFDAFLAEIGVALASGKISPSLKKRAANLSGTFIPQVAEYNGIKDPSAYPVTAEALRGLSTASLSARKEGVAIILSALMVILKEAGELA
ncbi:MAG TPA: hypothetical protein VFF53_00825 [Geobacteraceae bacterium]|nr:hypothetical protein [Geobacteraceae bacterium]